MQLDWRAPLPVSGVRLSLWKALARFRVATLLFCLFLILRWRHLYAHWTLALAVGAVMTAVTLLVWWLAEHGRAHRVGVVAADTAVTFALTLATLGAQTSAQHLGGMPTLTTLWAAGPVIEAGFLFGWFGGVLVALVQTAAAVIVRHGYDRFTASSAVLLVIVGAISGYVSALVVHAENELAEAGAARARLVERERLGRTVHDGVLQVLALVHRTGRDAGGRWAELAAEAGTQEAALRALVASRAEQTSTGVGDLTAALRELRTDRVNVSAPADPVEVPRRALAEITAAVRAALHNVETHAGPGAQAWVLLERLDDSVALTVRDDGTGFPLGRLADAERAGRLGVAASIRGRIEDMGGQVSVTSTPGDGTVVRMSVPLGARL